MTKEQKIILAMKVQRLGNAVLTLENLKKDLEDFGVLEMSLYEGKRIDDIVEQIQDLQMGICLTHIEDLEIIEELGDGCVPLLKILTKIRSEDL